MARLALRGLGSVILLLGVIGVLTPIPFGIVFIVIAMLLLIPTTPSFTRMVRRMRVRSSRFDRVMEAAIRRTPAPYRRILRQTDIKVF